jgi:hypothetical protein
MERKDITAHSIYLEAVKKWYSTAELVEGYSKIDYPVYLVFNDRILNELKILANRFERFLNTNSTEYINTFFYLERTVEEMKNAIIFKNN